MEYKKMDKLTEERLKDLIEDIMYPNPPPDNIKIWTGYGGAKEFAREWLKQVGVEDPTDERLDREIQSMINAGWIKYDGNGLFELS